MRQVLITITIPDGIEVDVRTMDPSGPVGATLTPVPPREALPQPPMPGEAQRGSQTFEQKMEQGAKRAALGCPEHGTDKLREKGGRTFCAGRLQNGQWCPWTP